MKYLIVSDIHGSSLEPLKKILEMKKVNKLICLGDFDTIECIEDFIDLEKKFNGITVPGNHEHSHFHKVAINSGEMQKKGYSSIQLQVELDSNEACKMWVKSLLQNFSKTFKIDRTKHDTMAIHGGLGGANNGQPAELWNRMMNNVDFEKNLQEMKKKKIWLMLRGHDHVPQYVYSSPVRKLVIQTPEPGLKTLLSQEMMHIVNPGAYCDGYYAMIDTDYPGEVEPMLSFHKFVVERE